MKVGFVSLGCSKNLIDTEIAIGHFKNNNYEIENDPEKADIIVINTCGFIESAKEEAINTILEMAEYKKTGSLKALIVTGCLAQRYQEEIKTEIPEVDAILGTNSYDDIVNADYNYAAAKKQKDAEFTKSVVQGIIKDTVSSAVKWGVNTLGQIGTSAINKQINKKNNEKNNKTGSV